MRAFFILEKINLWKIFFSSVTWALWIKSGIAQICLSAPQNHRLVSGALWHCARFIRKSWLAVSSPRPPPPLPHPAPTRDIPCVSFTFSTISDEKTWNFSIWPYALWSKCTSCPDSFKMVENICWSGIFKCAVVMLSQLSENSSFCQTKWYNEVQKVKL